MARQRGMLPRFVRASSSDSHVGVDQGNSRRGQSDRGSGAGESFNNRFERGLGRTSERGISGKGIFLESGKRFKSWLIPVVGHVPLD